MEQLQGLYGLWWKMIFSSSSSEIYPKGSELLSLFLCICTHTASHMIIDGKTEAEYKF